MSEPTAANPPPEPRYERFDTNEGFQAAIDLLLEQPGRELRVFDPDLSMLRLNAPERVAQLQRFLLASRTRRLLDASHYVRRPSAQFFRGAVGINDENEALAMRGRFMEIWAASFPAVSSTTVGL